MTRIAVTGGCGFIGSHFIKHIRKTHPDYQIVVFDKFTYAGNPDNVDFKDDHISLIAGDVAVKESVERLTMFGKIDYLVNFAAETFVDASIHSDPLTFCRTNAIGTLVLLNWLREHPETRYLQVSTDEVYGDLPLEGDEKFDLSSQIQPNNPYSASKASADHFVLSYVRTFGVDARITRCSNNYGSHQFPEKFIPRMVIKALANEPLPIYGEGTNIRDWIHVSDHVRGIAQALHFGKSGEVYNFGGDAEYTNLEVAQEILRLLGKPIDRLEYVTDRPGHDLRYAIDTTEVLESLCWAPLRLFTSGLQETVEWYTQNPEWVNRIEDGSYRNQIPHGFRDLK